MAEGSKKKVEKRKGSDVDTETAAREHTRRMQQGAQGAGKDGPMDESGKEDQPKRPDQKTGRG